MGSLFIVGLSITGIPPVNFRIIRFENEIAPFSGVNFSTMATICR